MSFCGGFDRGPKALRQRETLHGIRYAAKMKGNQFCLFRPLNHNKPSAAENAAEPKHNETYHNGRADSDTFSPQRGNRIQKLHGKFLPGGQYKKYHRQRLFCNMGKRITSGTPPVPVSSRL
jgi:hypothetical protein